MNQGTTQPSRTRRVVVWLSILASLLLAGFGASAAAAAPTTMVNLGQAAKYTVLAGPSITNTVSAPGAPHTTIRGDLGVKADTAPGGFPPGVVTGTIRHGSSVDPAYADMAAAYAEIAARQNGAPLAGALVGATILPGLHTITGAASNTGTVTLNGGGDPNAVFVIQVSGALSFAAGSHVLLTNGARPNRVFWQVNGAGAVGALADFAGTMIAKDAVGIGNGVLFNGRAYARDGAMTLDNNEFFGGPPVVTIDGGASAQTTDTTPVISGTTDLDEPGTVTVTIAGQTLEATPSGGVWSVESAILPNGTYPVVASVEDGVGNPGSATQQLTVDTVLPSIAIDGGPTAITDDSTPTISGTTGEAAGTIVRVNVGNQNLQALVNAGGGWNVAPTALTDGPYVVTAEVSDPAGNVKSATQTLTVDTTAPSLTINGGATALTNDPTPTITGSSDVTEGTTVNLTIANEDLNVPVDGAGNWSVTASALADGPHRIVATVEDGAGNGVRVTQILTVDTVAPLVSINGGANTTTERTDPTITGTSDAAAGTTISVTVAGDTMTTLLQGNGSWNTHAGEIGNGVWQVVASVTDPAGNVGTFTQTLTIGPAVTPSTFKLMVSKTGNGQGTIRSAPTGISCGAECSKDFSEGTSATLEAEAATGSDFTGWSGACTGSSSCTVGMDQAKTVEAAFTLQKRTLTSTKTGNGGGQVTASPVGADFDYGTVVTLKADPAAGSTFSGWGGACSGTASCTLTMDRAHAVSAGFADKAPEITKLSVAPKKVSLSGKSKSSLRRQGPVIKLDLSEGAKVAFRLTRKTAKALSFQTQAPAGASSVRIPKNIRKKIKRGRYTMTAVATDSAGQNSDSQRATFKVVR